MHPKNLPITTLPTNTGMDILSAFEQKLSIKGKKCLCIGYDQKQLKKYVSKYRPKEIVILTLWEDHKDALSENKVIIGDISKKTPFEDNEFDFVLTLSLLEHVIDLRGAFKEIRRILKPEGYFASFFGPVWSCHVGHHFYADPGNKLYDFNQWEMPTHIHLLSTAEEIKDYYISQGASKDQSNSVIHWFYETNIINRVFYDDYLTLFSEYFFIVATDLMYADISIDILDELKKAYPNYSDFTTYGGKFLLKNRKKGHFWSLNDAINKCNITWQNGFYRLEGKRENNWRWCCAEGNLNIDNNSTQIQEIFIEMSLSTGSAETSYLRIKSDLFSEIIEINNNPYHFKKQLTMPPGNHVIKFESDATKVNAPEDQRQLYFRVDNFILSLIS